MKNFFKSISEKIFGKKEEAQDWDAVFEKLNKSKGFPFVDEYEIPEKNKTKHKRKVGRPKKKVKPVDEPTNKIEVQKSHKRKRQKNISNGGVMMSVCLSKETYDKITKGAEKWDISRSHYVHTIIKNYFNIV